MNESPERLRVAIAGSDVIERVEPALKGGLGAARRVLKDALARHPSGCAAARRAVPSRAFRPGITRGRA
jgi:hypothetical protein